MRCWSVVVVAAAASGCGDNPSLPVDAGPGIDTPCVVTMSATPTQIDFGTVGVQQAVNSPLVITNTGTCSTRPVTHALTGSGASSYAIATSSCAGVMLAPGGACAVDIRFAPQQTGAKIAVLAVDGGDAPLMIQLAGASVTVDNVFISGSPYTFPTTTVATTSAPRRYVVMNAGGMSSPPFAVMPGGPDPSEFVVVADTCSGVMLPAGQTCHLDVVFAPTSTGTKSAFLVISAFPFGQVTAAMSGTAVTAPSISISPTVIDFGTSATPGTAQVVTVTNTTAAATGALATSLGGPQAGSYAIADDTCTGMTLAPGTTCTFEVRTTCNGVGTTANALASVTGTPGGTASVSITGRVASACEGPGPINPTTANFGTQVVTTTGPPRTFTLSNPGSQPLSQLTASLGGTNANQFVITSDLCTGVTLGTGASCSVQVAFRPTSLGVKNGSLTITTAFGSTSAALTGTGMNDPLLTIAPATWDFGATALGTKTFTITNPGAGTTGALALAINGPNTTAFELRNDTCSGATLTSNATCTFDVRTTCNGPFGATFASVDVTGTPGGSVSAALTASVPASSCPAPAKLELAPATKDFGSVSVSSTSMASTFTVTNTGDVSSSTVTTSISGEFQIVTDGCTGAPLAAHTSCTITARFAPVTLSNTAKVGALTASASTGGQAQSDLTGFAISAPGISMTPTSLVFPATTSGMTSSPMPITVTNNGAQTTGTLAVSLSGSSNADFVISSDTCTGTQLPGVGQCMIEISFRPTATGTRTATVTATANPGGTVAAALQGIGQ